MECQKALNLRQQGSFIGSDFESECQCPPPVQEPVRIPPEKQTARLKLEKRPKGKMVTVVANLDPEGNDLDALAAQLKTRCGSGGTVKDGRIEIQGDQRERIVAELEKLGYKVKRVGG